jgi:hypothetical protein
LQPVGWRGNGQTGHEFALVVVNAGGHAAYAQFQLFVVAGAGVLARFGEFSLLFWTALLQGLRRLAISAQALRNWLATRQMLFNS